MLEDAQIEKICPYQEVKFSVGHCNVERMAESIGLFCLVNKLNGNVPTPIAS